MALYTDLDLQDSVKEQLFRYTFVEFCFISFAFLLFELKRLLHRCKLGMWEKKYCTGMEKLKALIEGPLQNGIPISDILDKTTSILRKPLLVTSGCSNYCGDIPCLFSDTEDDLAPLCLCWPTGRWWQRYLVGVSQQASSSLVFLPQLTKMTRFPLSRRGWRASESIWA